jgi:hypothetical protein
LHKLCRKTLCYYAQNWRDTHAKKAFGHLRHFALAHMVVQEIPRDQGTRAQRRAQRDSRLDAARQHLLEYAKIAEKVSSMSTSSQNLFEPVT